jgi:hypothetical protein
MAISEESFLGLNQRIIINHNSFTSVLAIVLRLTTLLQHLRTHIRSGNAQMHAVATKQQAKHRIYRTGHVFVRFGCMPAVSSVAMGS